MRPRISLICHATTKALRAATFGGNDPLDEAGKAQAQRLLGSLGHVDRCFTSPALRARETALALGLSATVDERLRECDFGRWSGLRFNGVLLREPRKLVSWIRDPSSAPHGGETIPQVLERAAAWLREVGTEKGHTVAITHATVIRAIIVAVIEARLPSFWRVDVTPLSRTDLRTNGRRWVLRSFGPLVPVGAFDEEHEEHDRPGHGGPEGD
ncbi:MAG TPA: histidine phosphatase family protein [Steroidobacteraceae bacterium]|nr:histidine phosphatase family protein [Steroidobacteraceae bacterium]